MNAKGIRRKKSSLAEVKVAVVGARSVGKSAVTVRFLTRRYIGEYDHKSENRYKHEVLVDGDPILFEILDTCPKTENELPSSELLHWADGLLLIYSVTDRSSFNYIRRVTASLPADVAEMPLYLIGNKSDMIHLREVPTTEGRSLAKECDCPFAEVAAAEQVSAIATVFHDLCKMIVASRRKSRHSLLGRMLGAKSTSGRIYARGKSDSALPKA